MYAIRSYYGFEFLVKQPDGSIIEESFYNQRVTIALPLWPARFQDSEFRVFCENLFRSLAPAYLRLEFYWLGIARMKKFETLFFEFFVITSYSIHYTKLSRNNFV